jgi:hypothetical protein
MSELYANARSGNIDFFRRIIEREWYRDNENGRQVYDDPYSDFFVWDDAFVINYSKELMRQIVESRLNRTYRRRAFLLQSGGILFDYSRYDLRRGIRYIVILTFNQDGNAVIDGLHIVRCGA